MITLISHKKIIKVNGKTIDQINFENQPQHISLSLAKLLDEYEARRLSLKDCAKIIKKY